MRLFRAGKLLLTGELAALGSEKAFRSFLKPLGKPSLARFYEVIDTAQDIKHQIMFRLLFFTALRVSELCRIEMGDVNLSENKIFISPKPKLT